jgi:hypothetical protein
MAEGVGIDQLTTVAAVAGPGVGGGIAVWSGFKFVRWMVEFVFRRLDVSRSHLGQRLRHVEQELDAYREATMLMIGVVAKLDPDNAALIKVARMLRTITPRATLELDELEARLNGEGRHGMAKN